MTFMTFEEFLAKQKKKDYVFYSFFKDSNYFFEQTKKGVKPDKVISVSDLGEWAYSQMEFWDIQIAFTEPYNTGHFDFAKKIAIGLLGEKEVEKRWNNYLKKKELEKKEFEKQKQESRLSAEKQEKEFEKYFTKKQDSMKVKDNE